MNRLLNKAFLDLDESEIVAYAEVAAANVALTIPPDCRAAVIDNLTVLRGHSRLVAKALAEAPVSAKDAELGAFEP